MNELKIFNNPEFGDVRTIEEEGKVLFCGSDVTRGLGYKNSSKALSDHCKGVTKRYTPTASGNQEMNFIPEGDIYRLAAKSELPGAERFESWIFDEVLPSIRKHGAYMTPETLEAALLDPDTMIKLCTTLKEERNKRKALEAENAIQRQVIADYTPKVQYLDLILGSKESMTVTQIAADYDISARRLNQILHDERVQWYVNGQWVLYREHMGMGYTHGKLQAFERRDGPIDHRPYTEWTQKGRLFIHELLKTRGIMARHDRELAGEQLAI